MNKIGLKQGLAILKEYLKSCCYQASTIKEVVKQGERFCEYVAGEHGIQDLREVRREEIKGYLEYIKGLVSKKTGKKYKENSLKSMIRGVKVLYKSLYVGGHILSNPCQDIKWVAGIKGKREVLREEEINKVLESIGIDSLVGLRDRTIFELMYSSGLRCVEVANLKVEDIDIERRYLVIRGSKFGKDRVVPVSKVAVKFLKQYLGAVSRKRGEYVFVNMGLRKRERWKKLAASSISGRFREVLKRAGELREGISAHSIRHACATHLLEHGADVRYVQELLGHESIETTVQYTHALYENLKRVYKSYHPRENEYFKEVDKEYRAEVEKLLEVVKKARLWPRKGRKVIYKEKERR